MDIYLYIDVARYYASREDKEGSQELRIMDDEAAEKLKFLSRTYKIEEDILRQLLEFEVALSWLNA